MRSMHHGAQGGKEDPYCESRAVRGRLPGMEAVNGDQWVSLINKDGKNNSFNKNLRFFLR